MPTTSLHELLVPLDQRLADEEREHESHVLDLALKRAKAVGQPQWRDDDFLYGKVMQARIHVREELAEAARESEAEVEWRALCDALSVAITVDLSNTTDQPLDEQLRRYAAAKQLGHVQPNPLSAAIAQLDREGFADEYLQAHRRLGRLLHLAIVEVKPRQGRHHRKDAGNKLKQEVRQEFLTAWFKGHDWANMTLTEIAVSLQGEGLKVSRSTLLRDMRTLGKKPHPRSERPHTARGRGEREAVSDPDAWTMPDDPDHVS